MIFSDPSAAADMVEIDGVAAMEMLVTFRAGWFCKWKLSVVDLVSKVAEALGGKGGGGRPDMAQAGGPDGAKANDALKAIESALSA